MFEIIDMVASDVKNRFKGVKNPWNRGPNSNSLKYLSCLNYFVNFFGIEWNEFILHIMDSKLIFFSKQKFNIFPSFLWSSESLKVKPKILGDVDAHEAEGFI